MTHSRELLTTVVPPAPDQLPAQFAFVASSQLGVRSTVSKIPSSADSSVRAPSKIQHTATPNLHDSHAVMSLYPRSQSHSAGTSSQSSASPQMKLLQRPPGSRDHSGNIRVPKGRRSLSSKRDSYQSSRRNSYQSQSDVGSPPSSAPSNYGAQLYKTELCRSFTDTGYCRYGLKCRFAHGQPDLRPVTRHKRYKTEKCKNFARTGQCPYGVRCRFIHDSKEKDTLALSTSLQTPPLGPIPFSSLPSSPALKALPHADVSGMHGMSPAEAWARAPSDTWSRDSMTRDSCDDDGEQRRASLRNVSLPRSSPRAVPRRHAEGKQNRIVDDDANDMDKYLQESSLALSAFSENDDNDMLEATRNNNMDGMLIPDGLSHALPNTPPTRALTAHSVNANGSARRGGALVPHRSQSYTRGYMLDPHNRHGPFSPAGSPVINGIPLYLSPRLSDLSLASRLSPNQLSPHLGPTSYRALAAPTSPALSFNVRSLAMLPPPLDGSLGPGTTVVSALRIMNNTSTGEPSQQQVQQHCKSSGHPRAHGNRHHNHAHHSHAHSRSNGHTHDTTNTQPTTKHPNHSVAGRAQLSTHDHPHHSTHFARQRILSSSLSPSSSPSHAPTPVKSVLGFTVPDSERNLSSPHAMHDPTTSSVASSLALLQLQRQGTQAANVTPAAALQARDSRRRASSMTPHESPLLAASFNGDGLRKSECMDIPARRRSSSKRLPVFATLSLD